MSLESRLRRRLCALWSLRDNHGPLANTHPGLRPPRKLFAQIRAKTLAALANPLTDRWTIIAALGAPKMNGGQLRIIVVSEESFARAMLTLAARDSGQYRTVVGADDGYTALAEAWTAVMEDQPPHVFFLDIRKCDPSIGRLLLELRSDPVTRGAFVVGLTHDPALNPPGLDLITRCSMLHDELLSTFQLVANLARSTDRSQLT
jgi:hypothetical protein